MHYRQTTLVHLADTDTLAIERDRTGMIGATVRDATGNTVARIEFIGRLEQLDPVALVAVATNGRIIAASNGWYADPKVVMP